MVNFLKPCITSFDDVGMPKSNVYFTRMGYEVARLVLHALSTVYSPIKDMFLCIKGKAEDVKKLEDNLANITAQLATFYSRKEKIDRSLETFMSKEANDEYIILEKQIEVVLKRYRKFVDKYGKYCRNLPNFDVNDISSATDVMDALQERKPTILTHKFFKLAKISKEVNELLDHTACIIKEMKGDNVLRDRRIEAVQVKHADIDVPSSTRYVEEILKYLDVDDNRSIGIMGTIGVGKTTIMKKLNNQLKHSEKFDVVIWINCHEHVKDKVIEVIQDAIMQRLKLHQEATNDKEQNKDIISRALQNKKYIVLIDQVSSTIDFDEVGIHKDHKFRKVVIASSNRKVTITMTDKQVEIKPLSPKEALDLFREVCGNIKDPRFDHSENVIVKSCGGLPLVIKLVATHLKGEKDEGVWSAVMEDLQSETKGSKSLPLGGVGNAYKLVYDKLEQSHMKCLLFTTLFPSDYEIYKDYLVECWNAERFLEDIQQLRSARDRGATVLRELTNQYLLENHSAKHVKMPKYFRKIAVELEYPGEQDYLSWPPEKIKSLTEDLWKKTKRVSLIRGKSELPESPESYNISTLLMEGKPDLPAFGAMFFSNMQNLRILDLNQTMIQSLPASITSLVSLICLYLNDCPLLVELPHVVRTLEKLELLDIRGTSIHSLPSAIGDMSHLRCLRISFCRKGCNGNGKQGEVGMEIPLDILCRLRQLEELTIEAGCCSQAWDKIVDDIVIELTCLEKLSTLNFHFPRVSNLKKFVTKSESLKNTDTHWNTNTFRSFNISIGCCEMQHPYGLDILEASAERHLIFSTDEEISSIGEVLRQASSFQLARHSGVRSLSDFNLDNVGTLKVCVVECCENMTSIVNLPEIIETHMNNFTILQCLEKLHLFDLRMLRSIWKGPILSGSLANLKVLTIYGCPELTVILNHDHAKTLSCLEHVKVENCSKVVEIIEVEKLDKHNISEDVDLSHILNKVVTIELVNLSGLKRICKSASMKWRSLINITVISCDGLRDFHSTLNSLEKLPKIKCEYSWWTTLQLPEEQKRHFLPHCCFIVKKQNPAIRVNHEGESSEHGRIVDSLPSNADDSTNYNGAVMPISGNNLFMSIKNYVDHAKKNKEVNPDPEDTQESSQGIEDVTHHSTNTNASPKKEALSIEEERFSKNGFWARKWRVKV